MKKLTKILVPVEGSEADEDAVRLACQVARSDKATVVVVYVIEVQRNLPLDAEDAPQLEYADSVLRRAEGLARDCGRRIETEVLQARVAGSVIVSEAVDRGVDLIILGLPHRRPLGANTPLGSTASYVLANATCPVWLCRVAAPSSESRS